MRAVRSRRRWQTFALVAALVGAAALAGCNTLSYYAQAARGQMELLHKRRPIADVIADRATPERTRAQLAALRDMREFASRALALPDNGTFRSYTDVGRPFVIWNVFATPELSNTLDQWCFPIAGCITYRGYFSRSDAEAFAATLTGHDVHVGGVPAYSTLGWFDDPVLSTFIHYPQVELARLVFHELAHQVAYVKDDSTFNESFATAVEEEGMRRWVLQNPDREAPAAWREAQRRREEFQALVLKYRGMLDIVYASSAPDDEKRSRKRELLQALQDEYAVLRASWNGYPGYDRWFAQNPNNAHLASVAVYTQKVPVFLSMLRAYNGDLPAFYAEVRRVAHLDRTARDAAVATYSRPVDLHAAAAGVPE